MLKLTLRSVLQIFSIGIIGVAVLCGVLVWKLASGPIYLSFLTPYLESSFNSSDGEVKFKVDDTLLEWNVNQNNLQLNLQGVKAVASDGTLIVQVSNLSVELSGAALFNGKLAPKSIGIFGPIVNIVRTEFGDLEFGMIQSERSIAKINASENKVLTDILYEIFVSKDQSRPLGYLKQVNILNADLNVDDRQLGAKWRSPKTDVSLILQQNNLFVSASLVLKPGNPGLHRPTSINLVGNYSLAAKDAKITVGFADLNPAELYSLSHRLTFLKMFDFPIGGTVDVLVTADGRIDNFEFDLKGGEGQVSYSGSIGLSADVTKIRLTGEYNNKLGLLKIDGLDVNFAKNKNVRIAKLYNGELSIQKLSLSGDYDSDFKKFVFRKRSFLSKDLSVEATGKIQQIGRETIFELSSQASEIPIDYIPIVWLEGLATGVTKSIAKTLSQGVITSAKANLNGKYSNASGFEIGSIISVLDYRDAAITLHSPALKVTNSKGRIRFDGKTITADIMSGKSDNLLIRRGKILVTGPDSSDPLVNINLQVNGQLETALRIAKELPFDLPVVDNPLSGGVSGTIHSTLNFSFRLKEVFDPGELKFSADAYMKNASFPRAIMNMDLTNANLRLKVNNEHMKVTGTGGIAGLVTRIEWQRAFKSRSDFHSKYIFRTQIDNKLWQKTLKTDSLPVSKENFRGTLDAEIIMMVNNSGTDEIKAHLDLKDTEINFPRMGWSKSKGKLADATLDIKFKENKLAMIPKFRLIGSGINIDASASFTETGTISKVILNRFLFGQTDVQADAEPIDGAMKNGWKLNVTGKNLDLRAWMAAKNNDPVLVKNNALKLNLKLDTVQLYEGKRLSDVTGSLFFDGWVWSKIKLSSGKGAKKILSVKLNKVGTGRELKIVSKDAGQILNAFDYYENLIGGKLSLEGMYEGMMPASKFVGRAEIENFRVIKAPILAKLLDLASVTGIVDELLGGVGISFAKLKAPFESQGDIIKVKNASVSGLSVGMTATGQINQMMEKLDMAGTIVPAYVLNTALTRLPIIGNIFSGGEKDGGVFAANYTMSGNIKEPKISANPLSVLAPGLLRELFKIFDMSPKAETINN